MRKWRTSSATCNAPCLRPVWQKTYAPRWRKYCQTTRTFSAPSSYQGRLRVSPRSRLSCHLNQSDESTSAEPLSWGKRLSGKICKRPSPTRPCLSQRYLRRRTRLYLWPSRRRCTVSRLTLARSTYSLSGTTTRCQISNMSWPKLEVRSQTTLPTSTTHTATGKDCWLIFVNRDSLLQDRMAFSIWAVTHRGIPF